MNTCANTRFIASAGTGKTHQVVTLYQSLLFGKAYPADDTALPGIKAGAIFGGGPRIPPERILMLTFTRNAAAEMRSRVTEAIERELAGGDPANEAYCWALLRRLSSATISTIHAFAQQVLASHTLYLGLSPTLSILEETDAEDLRTEIITETLKAGLSGTDRTLASDLESLCEGRGIAGIEEGVVRTLRCCAAWGLDLTGTDPAHLVVPPVVPEVSILRALTSSVAQAATARTGKTIKAMEAAMATALRHLGDRPKPEAVCEAAAQLRPLTTSSWGSDEGVKLLRAEVQEKLDALIAYPARVEATRLLTTFLSLAQDCALRLQSRKRAQGTLDFDDLLFKAYDLIRERPGCVPALDVIIVDEAQDNSRLQNELVRVIQAASKASMVLCGDTKQTIYGWRGADAGGLPRFAATLRLGDVPLRTSYRSQQGILDWVNDIFAGTVLGPGLYGENETLSPCPAAVKLGGPSVELLLPDWEWGPKPDDAIAVGKKEPKPRLSLTPREVRTLATANPADKAWQEAALQCEQAVALEARAVARRIRLLTTAGTAKRWRPDEVWNTTQGGWEKAPAKPYRYRDILILLRASTRQELYEQALQEEGIPFTTDGKGRGFFARQETLDVANLLSWLAFPNDHLARLGVLRSPFVGLSDNAVALLDSPLFDPASGFAGRRDSDLWRQSETVLARLRQLTGRVSAVDLVREAIRLTGYDAILAGTFHGVQRLANLQKLLSWIQSCERDDNLNLQDLARRLSGEIKKGREAPDAAVLDPDDDSVRINTVHAAKGLSSPVVFLPDLRRTPAGDRDWIQVTRTPEGEADGLAGKVRCFDEDLPEDVETEAYSTIAEQNKQDRDHESRRLFYVACTRARDLLVLSGENPGNGSKDSWRVWINQHILQCGFRNDLIRLSPYGEVAQAWRKIAPLPPAAPETSPTKLAEAYARSPARRERYRLPVTSLVHASAPANAEAVRLTLAPVMLADAGEDHEAPEPMTDRSERGTLAHRILECLDYASKSSLHDQIAGSPSWPDDKARAELLPRVEAAAQVLAGRLKGVAPEDIIRELPFAARFTHDGAEVMVDGKVDLVFFKEGAWHILDYKFTQANEASLKARYALQLEVYREALSVPGSRSDLRRPRFTTPRQGAAPFKLVLMGIPDEGPCTEIEIASTTPAVAPLLISAARVIHG